MKIKFLYLFFLCVICIACNFQGKKSVAADYIEKDDLLSKSETKKQVQVLAEDIVGLWKDDMQPNVLIRIRKDPQKGYIYEYVSSIDGSFSEWFMPLTKQTKNGKTIFVDTEDPEQYFQVEESGNLGAYDNYGFVVRYNKATAPK